MERSRLGLTRNDGRKPRKVIFLYIIFCCVIACFRFVGFFIFFTLFKGEAPLSGARLGQCQLDSVINEVKDIVFPGKAHFSLGREGKLQYVTPGDGKLRSAAYAVLGREFSRDLMELDNQEGVYRVWGLITQPRSCRASRSMQYFYIMGAMSATAP